MSKLNTSLQGKLQVHTAQDTIRLRFSVERCLRLVFSLHNSADDCSHIWNLNFDAFHIEISRQKGASTGLAVRKVGAKNFRMLNYDWAQLVGTGSNTVQAWYLQRERLKLHQIQLHDQVCRQVLAESGVTVHEHRARHAHLVGGVALHDLHHVVLVALTLSNRHQIGVAIAKVEPDGYFVGTNG